MRLTATYTIILCKAHLMCFVYESLVLTNGPLTTLHVREGSLPTLHRPRRTYIPYVALQQSPQSCLQTLKAYLTPKGFLGPYFGRSMGWCCASVTTYASHIHFVLGHRNIFESKYLYEGCIGQVVSSSDVFVYRKNDKVFRLWMVKTLFSKWFHAWVNRSISLNNVCGMWR